MLWFQNFIINSKAAIKLNDKIVNALNNKIMVGGTFCYLQKAFDCVIHNI